jgi:Putative adhesin
LSTGGQGRGSILGGVLLILLGVLFLFARWNPNLQIWHAIWHYWPVLIILWGFAKLFDHLTAQQEGRARPPLVTGSEAALLVLVILVVAGMGLYSRIRERHPDIDLNLDMFHEQASQNVDVPVKKIPAGSHVTLTTERGNITVHAGDSDELRVNANLTASEGNESAAQERLKTVRVVIEQNRDGYTVHPVNQEDGESVTADLDVTVPKNVSIAANTNHGDISISGISGNAAATTLHGTVDIHNTSADASAEMSKGDVRINDVGGSVRITGHGDEVDISDVAGDTTIEGEFFGPVVIRNVTKTTRYVSQKADLMLEHLTGRLELNSGDIEISDVGGSAKLRASNKDLDIENVGGRLEISDVHGDIKVGYAKAPREEIIITNESGGVDLTLPDKSNFQISASSRGGDVQSDFEGTSDSGGDTPRFNAKIGTGVPKIQLTTTYGTITLHKSS